MHYTDDAPLSVLNSGRTWSRVVRIMFHAGIKTVGDFRHAEILMLKTCPGIGKAGKILLDDARAKLTQGVEPAPDKEKTVTKPTGHTVELPREIGPDDPIIAERPVQAKNYHEAVAEDLSGKPLNTEGQRGGEFGFQFEDVQERKFYQLRSQMTLAHKIEQVRRARGYVQKTELQGEKAPYKSAISHAQLIQLVRPLMVHWGIHWYPMRVESIGEQMVEKKGRTWFFGRYVWTFKFENVDDPKDYRLVTVLADALDDQDKGAGKASTYAEKWALVRLLNLEYGDDPDFTPMDLSPAAPDSTEKLVEAIKQMAEIDETIPDVDVYIRGTCADIAQKHHRKVSNIWSIPDNILMDWALALSQRIGRPVEEFGIEV